VHHEGYPYKSPKKLKQAKAIALLMNTLIDSAWISLYGLNGDRPDKPVLLLLSRIICQVIFTIRKNIVTFIYRRTEATTNRGNALCTPPN
jgi:hypothetical protein